MHSRRFAPLFLSLTLLLASAGGVRAQAPLPTPEEFLGHQVGADYQLVNYETLHRWWEALARASNRMVLDTIGTTSEGRHHVMAIITSPENHRNLDRYRDIARRLAHAEGISEEEARRLSQEGKAVVWIDGGLHATEVAGAQGILELVWQMVSMDDPETLRFLDDIILLAPHANPDGMDLVSNWYMRNPDPLQRSYAGIPVLYNKYAGHDNNRDFYMSNLAETRNLNRVAYREWFPQIMYNHHQTGPQGTIIYIPPFRGPPNHYLDGLILSQIELAGLVMHARLVQEGKGGSVKRTQAGFSTWWNGGLRTTPYYHNIVGLLSESNGHPTPMTIPFVPRRQMAEDDLHMPVEPTETWHFRQTMEYLMSTNRGLLDYASRNKEHLLYNIWRMGMNSIERGQRDHWTTKPRTLYAAADEVGGMMRPASPADYQRLMRQPELRDPRAFVLPANQADFPTAVKFVNTLLRNGIKVHRATAGFSVAGKQYPSGSLVVRADQAFRPFVLDAFEPQDHPDDIPYPGGAPTPPYDVAGWTLAFQMGVEFDRILDGFQAPLEVIDADSLPMPAGRVADAQGAQGYYLDRRVNNSVKAANRLLKEGREVFWVETATSVNGTSLPAGAFFVPGNQGMASQLEPMARELGVVFHGAQARPEGQARQLRPVRIGLWDQYGGSMPSGWTRYLLEDFEFDFRLVFPPELDEGNLRSKFDVLIFPDGAIPMEIGNLPPIPPDEVPDAELRSRMGPGDPGFRPGGRYGHHRGVVPQPGGTGRTPGAAAPGHRRRAAPPPGGVLRAPVDHRDEGGQHQPGGPRDAGPGGLHVQREPALPAAAGGRGPGGPTHHHRGQRFAAEERLGLGTVPHAGRGGRLPGDAGGGADVHVHAPDHLPVPAPRDLPAPLQQHLPGSVAAAAHLPVRGWEGPGVARALPGPAFRRGRSEERRLHLRAGVRKAKGGAAGSPLRAFPSGPRPARGPGRQNSRV